MLRISPATRAAVASARSPGSSSFPLAWPTFALTPHKHLQASPPIDETRAVAHLSNALKGLGHGPLIISMPLQVKARSRAASRR